MLVRAVWGDFIKKALKKIQVHKFYTISIEY